MSLSGRLGLADIRINIVGWEALEVTGQMWLICQPSRTNRARLLHARDAQLRCLNFRKGSQFTVVNTSFWNHEQQLGRTFTVCRFPAFQRQHNFVSTPQDTSCSGLRWKVSVGATHFESWQVRDVFFSPACTLSCRCRCVSGQGPTTVQVDAEMSLTSLHLNLKIKPESTSVLLVLFETPQDR